MTASIAGSSRVKMSRAPRVVAGDEGVDHGAQLVAGHVADDGDDAGGAVRQPGEVGDVVAGVDGVAELAQPDAAGEVADGVLDRDDRAPTSIASA